jgi:hypothetical protein
MFEKIEFCDHSLTSSTKDQDLKMGDSIKCENYGHLRVPRMEQADSSEM